MDSTLRSLLDTSLDAASPVSRWRQEQLHALAGRNVAPSVRGTDTPAGASEPASDDEVAAILTAVPRGCRANAAWAVPLLLDTARGGGITHPRRIAYLLATAHHASRFGEQLVEFGDRPAPDALRACERYEPGTPLGDARGNLFAGDGERYRGRGFVFVSGRTNYAMWSQRLGMPEHVVDGRAIPFFVAHPEAMARPHVAAQTLVRGMRDGLFTGVALGTYVNDKKTDYYNARKVIDGTVDAREIAALAIVYQAAIEGVAAERHRAHMQELADRRAVDPIRDLLAETRQSVARLAARGEALPFPTDVIDWNGEARQGKFIQLDERTCALHVGRGVYVRLDIERDLNGDVPPEAKTMILKRTGEVRPATRHGENDFWK